MMYKTFNPLAPGHVEPQNLLNIGSSNGLLSYRTKP